MKKAKYKIGDKVKLKTYLPYTDDEIREDLAKLPGRIATVENISIDKNDEKYISNYWYWMEEIGWEWNEVEIECLIEKAKETDIPIKNRWEILDIRRD